ncbi:zf-HC2 domain-containing protein [Streptomyces sp. NPDC057236]|uniref:zf-HC2 domain-containing protein n=1 Tax=Streptomyces sp. NPDC057236 TaxID=3346059 RepID=UPI00363AFDC9
MTGRHASDHLVTRYADGRLPESDAWPLEEHLESCTGCALRVSQAVRATTAGPALAGIREAVLADVRETVPADVRETVPADVRETVPADVGTAARTDAHETAQPHTGAAAPTEAYEATPAGASGAVAAAVPAVSPAPGPVSGAPAPARPAGFPARVRRGAHRWPSAGPRTVRVLWALGPAVRGAWLPAVLLVAVGAVALAHGAGFADARPWLLALAPVVPVAGVALSYGPHADPMYEITAATPSAGLRLVLMRTAAVLAVSLPLLTLAGALLPSTDTPNAAAWLLPGLALTLASLALAGYVGLRAATAVTGGGWLCAVLGPVLAAPGGPTDALGPRLSSYFGGAPAQGGWAAAAVLSAALLAARRPAFHFLEKS